MQIDILVLIVVTAAIFLVLGFRMGSKSGFAKYSRYVASVTINKLAEGGYIKIAISPDGQTDIIKIKDLDEAS